MNLDFTPRNVAKYCAKFAIHSVVAKRTETVIIDHTRFEEDDLVTDLGGHLVGWYVSDKLKPYTDKVVDKTADYITAKREAREAKKKDNPEEK